MLQRIYREENVKNDRNNRDSNCDPLMVSSEQKLFVCEPFNLVMLYEVINAVGNGTNG